MLERATNAGRFWTRPAARPEVTSKSIGRTLWVTRRHCGRMHGVETADFARHLRGRLRVIEDTLAGRELAIFRQGVSPVPTGRRLDELALDFGVSSAKCASLETH